jgi:hypothetical protein
MKKSLHLLAVIMITVLASCTTKKIENENVLTCKSNGA